MGNLKVEINYAEASATLAATRAAARSMLDWCDRLEKLLDAVARTTKETENA